jgi:hypothetical protein
VPLTGKVMLPIVWDSQGIIMIDYLEQCRTIYGTYYADELRRLHQEIGGKRRSKLAQGVLLLHDNAPAYTSHVAMAAAADCGFEFFSYSPSDFQCFRNLKPSFVVDVLEAMKVSLRCAMSSLRSKIESCRVSSNTGRISALM